MSSKIFTLVFFGIFSLQLLFCLARHIPSSVCVVPRWRLPVRSCRAKTASGCVVSGGGKGTNSGSRHVFLCLGRDLRYAPCGRRPAREPLRLDLVSAEGLLESFSGYRLRGRRRAGGVSW